MLAVAHRFGFAGAADVVGLPLGPREAMIASPRGSRKLRP
ncbi:hypothetical protein I547_2572 [Mycobacterium kansasii 824]|nr:hypothetical protein I547_2572 [Mycobacterium kansasii 824]